MATTETTPTPKKKGSSVRHTRAIRYDRTKRPNSMPLAAQVSEGLAQLVHPLTLAQVARFRELGLRERVLTLPVMVALVLQLIWRQVPSTAELTRLLHQEGFLWCSPLRVSEQALTQRLRTFPAELFQRVLADLLPRMQARWAARARPVSPALAWVRARYPQVWAVDGSTLDVLLRQVGLLRGAERPPLAGRMTALLNLCSRLPQQLWYEEDPQANDQRCWPRIQAALARGALLLYDLGYTNFTVFRELTDAGVTWVTRAKRNLVYTVEACLVHTSQRRDELVWIGSGADRQRVRLVQVLVGTSWRRYLTSELDAGRLPAAYLAALYAERWRIEEAYLLVKRLLGLAYLWTGSPNGVALQLWATWLLYAVLIDLTDQVADRLGLPLSALSVEMTYRALYHFTVAVQQGTATDVVTYLANNADWLGLIKRKRKRKITAPDLLTIPAGA